VRSLLERYGVDYGQWLALTKTALLLDLRSSVFIRGSRVRQAAGASALIGQVIFYLFTGGMMAAFVAISGDLFVSASLIIGYVMFMVGTAALLDHNAAITSPDDFNILGYQPIASRTYFAARFANVLVYTSAMTTIFSLLPLVAFFIKWGVAVGLGAFAGIYASSLFVALLMVAVYGTLLRRVGARRLKHLLSYVQFAFSFLVYGSYFALTRTLSRNVLATLSIRKSVLVLLVPPAWFASYPELAAGRTTPLETVPALLSVAAIVALFATVAGRLSLDYADRLGALSTASAPSPAPAGSRAIRTRGRSGWLPFFRTGEARAVAMLIRSQFANDMRFRMSILAILPLTVIYLLMGVSNGGASADPFYGMRASQGLGMVTIAMLMFPAMLKVNLSRSDAFRASWIFFSSPTDRTRLVLAAKNVLVVTFIIPYLCLVALALTWFTASVPHLFVHLFVVGLLSHLVLQIITVINPELPFSRPASRSRSSTRVFVIVMIVSFGAIFFPLLGPVIYRTPLRMIASVLVLVSTSVLLERVTRARIEAQAARLEFEA